jgi:hypothetical protein
VCVRWRRRRLFRGRNGVLAQHASSRHLHSTGLQRTQDNAGFLEDDRLVRASASSRVGAGAGAAAHTLSGSPAYLHSVGDEQGAGRCETRERKQEGTRCAGICGGLCLGVVLVEEDYVGVGDLLLQCGPYRQEGAMQKN